MFNTITNEADFALNEWISSLGTYVVMNVMYSN